MTYEFIEQAHKKEPIKLQLAQQCCDEVSEEFAEYFHTLDLIIMIAGIANTDTQLMNIQEELLALPSGHKLNNIIKVKLKNERCPTTLVGVIKTKEIKMMGLSSQIFHTAALIININHYSDAKSLKTDLYSLIWKILSLIDDETNNREEFILRNDDIFSANWNEDQQASRNMLADIFTGSLHETKAQKGFLKNIAKERTMACFENLIHYDAKSNPFPVMMETTQMIIKDFESTMRNDNHIEKSLKIVSEVIETMDENTIRYWQSFIQNVQEMAWGKVPIAHIIGAAIYASDNAYNKTYAHMLADILNVDPPVGVTYEGYNAFADQDAQIRQHKLSCLESLEYLQEEFGDETNPEPFFKAAQYSCHSLIKGKPSGFCAPALIAVAKQITNDPKTSKETQSKIFSAEIKSLPWLAIRQTHREIIAVKKAQKDVNLKTLIDILRREEETREAALLIKELYDLILSLPHEEKEEPLDQKDISEISFMDDQ
ncbi:MAG: hypothetical protein AB8B83_00475 [Bdellovibrionales bacterium]